ncbi:YgjV family protein [Photobacterium japonica]|uniref:YgjV family protein n=1 Tax=Photobacterium japonica TaxID=2910235 RepID=UPI003D13CB74
MPELNFAQCIGLVAFVVGASSFFHQDGKRFRLHLVFFQIILFSHFLLMDALAPAIGCGISALRSYASTRTQSTSVLVFFIILLWVMGLPNVQHHYELLPLFGTSVATWALFKAEGIQLRMLIMFNSFCWLINNLLLGSIGGIMMETTFIAMNIFTISKMLKARKAVM